MSRYSEAHANRNGPGDARPTALQIVEDEGMANALADKIILITGASSGLGIETAKALYQTGATLYLAVRDVSKGLEVAKGISGEEQPSRIHIIKLELDHLASVREAASAFLSKTNKLNILINNAGIMATPKGMKTKDGFDAQFGTNHLGHFLLFQLLKPALLAGSTPDFQSRVVVLSSIGHRSSPVMFDDLDQEKDYEIWRAYGQSKTANIYMANEIERRYGAEGLHATSLHPGGIATNLTRYLDMSSFDFNEEFMKMVKSPAQGAATTVWASIGKEWEGKGGKYLEECCEAKPIEPGVSDITPVNPGYKAYIYDTEAAKKLWDVSNELVGFSE